MTNWKCPIEIEQKNCGFEHKICVKREDPNGNQMTSLLCRTLAKQRLYLGREDRQCRDCHDESRILYMSHPTLHKVSNKRSMVVEAAAETNCESVN